MIFEISWSWYEMNSRTLFEGNHRSQRRWKRDCIDAIRRAGSKYIKEENGWVTASDWIEKAHEELEKMGYTRVSPINWGFFGSYIIGKNKIEDSNWKKIVGKELFDKALKKNQKKMKANDIRRKKMRRDLRKEFKADEKAVKAKKYNLIRNVHGYACAIADGEQWLIHLNPGTEFNKKNAQDIVDLLNKNSEKQHDKDD